MKIRINDNVLVRHVDNETLLVTPRSGGCTVLSDARAFIDALSHRLTTVDAILQTLAKKLDAEVSEISQDALLVYNELLNQGFIDVVTDDDQAPGTILSKSSRTDAMPADESDDMPLSGFYRHHGNLPVEFHIDLTDACTERCVHCYVPQKQHHYLPYELIEKAIREFRDMQGLSVHLTGGEAMMHTRFMDVCRLCKHLNLNIVIFSNMTLCDDLMVDFLQEIDPQFVNVSLYAMKAQIHDAITCRPGSWRATMGAVLKCEKAGVHIRIATPLLHENRNEISSLLKFTQQHNMHLIPSVDIVPRSNHDCSNLQHVCSCEELFEALSSNKELFDEGYGHERRPGDGKVCSIGTARIYLNAQGNYYPCDSMHGYVLGNVRQDTLDSVWHGEKLNELRALKDSDFGKCFMCQHRAFCKVCPAFNYNATGDVRGFCHDKCKVADVLHKVYGGGNVD